MVTKRSDLVPTATIHNQGNQFAVLNKDGTPRLMNHSLCAPVAPMSLDAFLADADVTNRGRPSEVSVGKVPIVAAPFRLAEAEYGRKRADQAPPITDLNNHSVKDILVLDLRREVCFDHPLVAPELLICAVAPGAQHQDKELALTSEREAQAELKTKMEVPSKIVAQGLIGKANKAVAADPRALLKDLTKVEKIDLTATAYAPNEPRATFAEAKETMVAIAHHPWGASDLFPFTVIAATRGAPANIFVQAAVPFQVMQRL